MRILGHISILIIQEIRCEKKQEVSYYILSRIKVFIKEIMGSPGGLGGEL